MEYHHPVPVSGFKSVMISGGTHCTNKNFRLASPFPAPPKFLPLVRLHRIIPSPNPDTGGEKKISNSQATILKHWKEQDLIQEPQIQTDIYARVTNKIRADLELGNLTWRQPWNSQSMSATVNLPLRWNNIPYTGINTILLWATAAEKNYPLSHWMTFN